MIEDYKIDLSIGMAKGTGVYETTKRGRRKEITKYAEEYITNAGRLTPEEWKEKALNEIKKYGEEELLEEIKEHCKKYPWLKTEEGREEYSIECLCSRAYRHWEDFRQETIILI